MDDHELDAALRRVMTAGSADDAAARMIARLYKLPAQERAFAWWPSALMNWDFTPAWPRLAALAGAAALGIVIGFSGYGTRIAAELDLVRVASADDTSVLDLDSVTGLRP